jgi:hypothetical protein
MTPNARFTEFLQDIEPSQTTKTQASQAHVKMRDFLAGHGVYGDIHVKTYLSGSYRRDTSIRPKREGAVLQRPDVDIIVVINHTLDDSPADAVDALYDAISDGYDDIRKQTRSVGVTTSTVDMDVVPIIEPDGEGNGLYIPDRELLKWLPTNPPGHTTWTTEINAKAGGRFKPLVKLMKWWRRQNPTTGRHPKGFVIECIVEACMDCDETHFGELFTKTLANIVSKYGVYVALGIVPTIADPAVSGNSVTSAISPEDFKSFFELVKEHAELARTAMGLEDQGEATALWRQIFGSRFPAPPSEKALGLLSAAITPTPGLQFPDRPVKPRKPAGFA